MASNDTYHFTWKSLGPPGFLTHTLCQNTGNGAAGPRHFSQWQGHDAILGDYGQEGDFGSRQRTNMLDFESNIIVIGGAALALAAVCAILTLFNQKSWARHALRVVAVLAVVLNVAFLVRSIQEAGITPALRQNVESTLIMALLLGLVGLGVHVSPSLRGLDIFLFALAAVVQFSALFAGEHERSFSSEAPWFLSHSLAFVLSAVSFVAGGAAGIAYLWINKVLRNKQAGNIMGAMAPLEALERFWRVMLVVGFPLFTYGVLTGFCGMYHDRTPDSPSPGQWLRDPFVIVVLLTWAVYAWLCVSLLFRVSIRGVRAARLNTAGMALVVVVFLFAGLISPLHR